MLPALSYRFGLKWRDVAEMPAGELTAYIDALKQIRG